MRKLLICAAMTFTVTGCLTPMQQTENIVGKNQPLPYKTGFTHGCSSGENAAGDVYSRFQKSIDQYESDRLYRSGWDDGYNHCLEKQKAFYKMLRG
jgi:hypothetical protein